MIGKTISHYKIIEKLGEGGMGVVYLAEDLELRRRVALKFLPSQYAADTEALSRFKREAQAAAALNHPNIITVHEVGTYEDRPFIVMAHVDGVPLTDVVARKDLPLKKVIEIGIQMCEGLSSAHEAGVVHRDIKPGNILVEKDGRVKILDFGLAKLKGVSKLTKEASTLGTVNYMSPEQARGEEVDHRSDIFSLGAVLYEMITGQPPFRGDHEAAVMYSIASEDPQPLQRFNREAADELERIVRKAMAKDRSERYHTVGDLLADLRVYRRGLESPAAGGKKARRRSQKIRWVVSAGILAVIVVLALLGRSYFFPKEQEAIDSIAVLPLEDLSGDPGQAYFADGMTEALISELGQLGALRVISRTSVMRYKGATKPLPEIARELDVDAIVEGSVLRVGDRVRITAQLIRAEPEEHLWAKDYERDLKDILALQKEVARAVTREINVKLTSQQEAKLEGALPVVNPEAHEAYLKGRFFAHKVTRESVTKAIEYYEEAIEKDPGYAPAYAGLAEAYHICGDVGWMASAEVLPKAKWAVEKALDIDDQLALAQLVMADMKLIYDWEWDAAERGVKRVIELNPNSAEAHRYYAYLLSVMGRHDEALAESKLVSDLDPVDQETSVQWGMNLYIARRYDEAIEKLRAARDLYPDSYRPHMGLGHVYLKKAMFAEAVAEFETAAALSNDDKGLSRLAEAYALSGETIKARQILDDLIEKSKREYVSPFFIARVYVGLDDKDQALEWLERGYEERCGDMVLLKALPEFDSLRSDPRFVDLLRRMGFEP